MAIVEQISANTFDHFGGNRDLPKCFYHSTHPDSAASILENGFKDRCNSGVVGRPGVWLSQSPVITSIGLDQFLGHLEESFLAVEIPPTVCTPFNQPDPTWPFSQFLIPADLVNRYPVREIPLADVIRIRSHQDPLFIRRLLDALEDEAPNYDFFYSAARWDWESLGLGKSRWITTIETSGIKRDRYLAWLRAIVEAVPEFYPSISGLVSGAMRLA